MRARPRRHLGTAATASPAALRPAASASASSPRSTPLTTTGRPPLISLSQPMSAKVRSAACSAELRSASGPVLTSRSAAEMTPSPESLRLRPATGVSAVSTSALAPALAARATLLAGTWRSRTIYPCTPHAPPQAVPTSATPSIRQVLLVDRTTARRLVPRRPRCPARHPGGPAGGRRWGRGSEQPGPGMDGRDITQHMRGQPAAPPGLLVGAQGAFASGAPAVVVIDRRGQQLSSAALHLGGIGSHECRVWRQR